MAWLSGWSYRKEISITGQSGAGTNYQAKLNIGDSAGGDFHLEGHCTNFPQDIEVTDNDGTSLLKFWIEDITADPLKMWVKVADDLGSNQTIYVYYGKSGATTNSNIENTFLFGDDLTTDNWTKTGTRISVNTTSNKIEYDTPRDSTKDHIGRTYSVGTGTFIFEFPLYPILSASGSILRFGLSTNLKNMVDFTTGDDGLYIQHYSTSDDLYLSYGQDGDWSANSGDSPYDMNTSTLYYMQLMRTGSTTAVLKVYSDSDYSSILHTANLTIPSDLTFGYVFSSNLADNSYPTAFAEGEIRSALRIRKYVATEPAFSSAGSEETPAADTSTDLLHGKIIIKDSSIILVDGLIQVKDSVTDLFDGGIKVIEKVTSLADGKLQVQDVATPLADGKLQVKDIVTGVADGKVQIQDIYTDLADGKLQVQDVDTDLADGIIQVKDSITSLADGKVQIQDTDIDLADGKVKVQDSATGLADGHLRVQDKATGMTDGKVQIQDTTTSLSDGKVQVKDSVTNLIDGKVIVSTVSTATGLADGKIQIKDVATGIVDGLLKIVVAIRRISIGNLKPSFRLITKNQKPTYRLVAEQPKPTYRLKTENK